MSGWKSKLRIFFDDSNNESKINSLGPPVPSRIFPVRHSAPDNNQASILVKIPKSFCGICPFAPGRQVMQMYK
jgi:hypothetical protein